MARFNREVVEEIRQRANIVDVVGSHVALKKRGKTYVGLCPFHADTDPSFTVSAEKQIFHCFGCGAGGSVFDFLMRLRNLSFIEAAEELAQRYNIVLPVAGDTRAARARDRQVQAVFAVNEAAAAYYSKMLRATGGERARQYLQQRRLPDETIRAFRLGYAPPGWDDLKRALQAKGFDEQIMLQAGLLSRRQGGGSFDRFRNRIIFPITDDRGRVVAFGGRSLGDDIPKYLNSPETTLFRKGQMLYGLYQAKEACRQLGKIVVVEGYFDLLALYGAGIQNVVAPLGTALTSQHVRLLARLAPEAILLFDGDASGRRAGYRTLELFLREGLAVRLALLPANMDPDDFVQARGAAELQTLLGRARPLLEAYLEEEAPPAEASVSAKVAAVRKMAPMLKLVDSGIELETSLQYLSRRLGLSEGVLRQEIGVVASGPRGKGARPGEAAVPAMEEVLLRILIHFPEWIEDFRRSGVLAAFADPQWQQLAMLMEKYCRSGGKLDTSGLLVELADHPLRRQVSGWCVEPCPWPESMARLRFREYIDGIKNKRQARLKDLKRLQQEIEAAERDNDFERLARLLAEKGALAAALERAKSLTTKGG